MTYNEENPTATSVKERYADLRSISNEDISSEEEYIPTGRTTTFDQGRINSRDSIYIMTAQKLKSLLVSGPACQI